MTYADKLGTRRDRLLERAAKAEAESASRHKTVMDICRITQGQPILIGHHSEKRHRRDLQRMDDNSRKSCELTAKAARLRERAASVGTGGISSEDENALIKLRKTIEATERTLDDKKALNAWWRKHKTASGFAFPSTGVVIKAETATAINTRMASLQEPGAPWVPDKHKPFPGYEFSNASANIRRMKDRLKQLEAEEVTRDAGEPEPVECDGFRFLEDHTDQRACIEFDKRPSREVCRLLRQNGWKWSPTNTRWQRLLNDNARASWTYQVRPALEKGAAS